MALIDTRTYCNPMSMPDCPRGADFPGSMKFTGEEVEDYRSISDPSVLYYEGKWYLYPSYGIGWVSEDFVTWKYVPMDPPDMFYSPAMAVRGHEIFMTGHSRPLYVSTSPTGPFKLLGDFIMPDGTTFTVPDPALFCDDDGELYLYWCDIVKTDNDAGFFTRTVGARLDREDPRKLTMEPVELQRFDPAHEWECFGQRNQDKGLGWTEGQWMIKYHGRYYLIYSGSGTQFASYAMGVYYSDKGPLEGFVYQPNNPLTESRHGLVSGAGHGCVVEGPNDSLWAFYTTTLGYAHCFERRIGMDPVYVDENGLLYCKKVTDTPQYGPGTPEALRGEPDTGLAPLTFNQRSRHRASSSEPERRSLYALDESLLTWWQPKKDDREPWLLVDLSAPYEVEAVRLIWREVGLDYDAGVIPAPVQYLLEGAQSPDGPFEVLLDERGNEIEENIAYRTFPMKTVKVVRLTITGWGEGLTPAVVSFSVFGKRSEKL